MTAADGRQLEEHKAMIADADRWPRWPQLFLKRGEEVSELQEAFSTGGYFWREGLARPGATWLNFTLEEAHALVDQGWMVD